MGEANWSKEETRSTRTSQWGEGGSASSLGYSKLLLLWHPGSDLNRSWVAAAEQCGDPREYQLHYLNPAWSPLSKYSFSILAGACQLPFSPTKTTSEQACPFQNSPTAALTTTPVQTHTKRRNGRTGVTSSWRGSVGMGLYHPYGCFTGHFYLTFCHHCNKRDSK